MSDLVTFGETMLRLAPPGNERIESAGQFEVKAAGSESNVAIAADRLGTESTWTSKVHDSPMGRRVVGALHQRGIDTEIVWSNSGRQGTYYQETAGRPRGTKVVFDREGAAVTTAEASEFDIELIQGARVFFTSGVTPALSNTLRETTVNMLKAARKAGTTTAFDVNFEDQLWSAAEARDTLTKLFPGINVLVISASDAREILDLEGEPRQIAHHLGSTYDFRTVVVTGRQHGALAWHDNVVHEQEAFITDIVDPVGAGDAFTGAFIARRILGDEVPQALEYGAATAALTKTIPGDAALVTKAEVEAVMESAETVST